MNLIFFAKNFRAILNLDQIYIQISMKEEPPTHKIEITVRDPETRKQFGGAKQYHIYALKGNDSKGSIDLHRRFSDFQSFRDTLVKKWPGVYIPSLPSRLKTSQNDEQYLELRSKYFEHFLSYFSTKQHIWYSEEMQFFLKSKEMSCQKVMGSFSKTELHEILYRYKTIFSKLPDQQENKQEVISQFTSSLKKLLSKIHEFRNKSQEILKRQTKYQRKYSACLLTTLEKYQNKCISKSQEKQEETDIKIINENACVAKKEELEDFMKECSVKILFEEFKRQKREILAFQQGLQQRQEYLSKKHKLDEKIKAHEAKINDLVQGKQSLISRIRSVSVESQIKGEQDTIQKYKSEFQECSELCRYLDIVTVNQIKQFKKIRVDSYYKMARDIMRSELELVEKEKEFWKAVNAQNQFSFQFEEAMRIKNLKSPVKKNKFAEEQEQLEREEEEKRPKPNLQQKQKREDLKQKNAPRSHQTDVRENSKDNDKIQEKSESTVPEAKPSQSNDKEEDNSQNSSQQRQKSLEKQKDTVVSSQIEGKEPENEQKQSKNSQGQIKVANNKEGNTQQPSHQVSQV